MLGIVVIPIMDADLHPDADTYGRPARGSGCIHCLLGDVEGKQHGGRRQTHYDVLLAAQKLSQFCGAAVIDGYDGMEGNGPTSRTSVPSRVAIASTDYGGRSGWSGVHER